jgi:aldehyde dehydrogenase (NAD+)
VLPEIKRKDQPLALYIFSTDGKYTKRILYGLRFGGGVINDTVLHYGNPHIPFGGTGQSGYGAYHGFHSFETFSHKKGILKKGNWLDVPVRYAPYTESKMKWLKRLFRFNIEW